MSNRLSRRELLQKSSFGLRTKEEGAEVAAYLAQLTTPPPPAL